MSKQFSYQGTLGHSFTKTHQLP